MVDTTRGTAINPNADPELICDGKYTNGGTKRPGICRIAGAVVSNHLSNTARDISIPFGSNETRNRIETRFNELGIFVIREPNAPGGPHWLLDQ